MRAYTEEDHACPSDVGLTWKYYTPNYPVGAGDHPRKNNNTYIYTNPGEDADEDIKVVCINPGKNK